MLLLRLMERARRRCDVAPTISPVEAYRLLGEALSRLHIAVSGSHRGRRHALREQALRAAAQTCVSARRPRLLCKITGWPRIGFLHAVFPKREFINVIRDGRAVASSCCGCVSGTAGTGPTTGAGAR